MSREKDIGEEYLEALDEPLKKDWFSIDNDYGRLLAKIESRFPIVGSTIDWKSVPFSVSAGSFGLPGKRLRFQEWFAGIVHQNQLTGLACVVGDGLFEKGVVGKVDHIVEYLPSLTDMPQHAYVIAYPNCEWCACLSFEGFMDFGYACR